MTNRNVRGDARHVSAGRNRLKVYFASLVLASGAVLTSGCASVNGFHSGGESTNVSMFNGVSDLEQRVASLKLGMSRAEVFTVLGVNVKSVRKLTRQEVTSTLYAGTRPEISGGLEEMEKARAFFNSLDGYSIRYRDVDEQTSFSFTRVNKTSKGMDVAVALIFKDGKLYDKPEISGGPVNQKSSTTYLKMLTGVAPVKIP